MNRKGENSFNMDEEKSKYGVGMEVYLKKKKGKIIYVNEHYITVEFDDGIKESFIWHELFDKYESIVNEGDEDEDEETDPKDSELEELDLDEDEDEDEE